MCETGSLHPETAYKVWFVHSCSLKLAVTMFTPTELECCHQNLAARRLVVPDPAPTFSLAQNIWPLTQAQLETGTIAQQQASRQVNIDHIRDSSNVIRTDGCYCTTPRTALATRLQQGLLTGPPTRCQLYTPKAPTPITQLNLILQRSPANRLADALQDSLRHSASGFLKSLSSLFSPIAGEGFTCLDHSKLSKKKKSPPLSQPSTAPIHTSAYTFANGPHPEALRDVPNCQIHRRPVGRPC